MKSISQKLWKYNRYRYIMTYHEKPWLPPPLILLSHIYLLIHRLCCHWSQDESDQDEGVFGLKLCLSDEELRKLHDFEEECVESYFHEKYKSLHSSETERIRATTERTEEMFMQLKEMNEKVFFIKDSLTSLDGQLGHLQDLSALTVDTLKVISAVDTLQMEEAIIVDQKSLTSKKIPHSWSIAPYSQHNKQYNYYSMPPSLLRTLVRSQWTSECQSPTEQTFLYLNNDDTEGLETEDYMITLGESLESKSASRYGNFLDVPSSPFGSPCSDKPFLSLAGAEQSCDLEATSKTNKTKDYDSVTNVNEDDGNQQREEQEGERAVKSDLELPVISIDEFQEKSLDVEEDTPHEAPTIVAEMPPDGTTNKPVGGYVNWAFSEEGEIGVFHGGKSQQVCIHPSHCEDCQCVNNIDRKVCSIEAYPSPADSEKAGENNESTDQRASFWINSLQMNWTFQKPNFKKHKDNKEGKTGSVKELTKPSETSQIERAKEKLRNTFRRSSREKRKRTQLQVPVITVDGCSLNTEMSSEPAGCSSWEGEEEESNKNRLTVSSFNQLNLEHISYARQQLKTQEIERNLMKTNEYLRQSREDLQNFTTVPRKSYLFSNSDTIKKMSTSLKASQDLNNHYSAVERNNLMRLAQTIPFTPVHLFAGEEVTVYRLEESFPSSLDRSKSSWSQRGMAAMLRIISPEEMDGGLRRALKVVCTWSEQDVLDPGEVFIVKSFLPEVVQMWQKVFHGDTVLQLCLREIQQQRAAQKLIYTFNQAKPHSIPYNLRFLEVFLIYCHSANQWLTIEKYLTGEFRKYNNNNGDEISPTTLLEEALLSFSHWTYEYTRGELLVLDLQGVGENLTDPSVIKPEDKQSRGMVFGPANLGEDALTNFVSKHCCNSCCRKLKLPDLKRNNFSPGRVNLGFEFGETDVDVDIVECDTRL